MILLRYHILHDSNKSKDMGPRILLSVITIVTTDECLRDQYKHPCGPALYDSTNIYLNKGKETGSLDYRRPTHPHGHTPEGCVGLGFIDFYGEPRPHQFSIIQAPPYPPACDIPRRDKSGVMVTIPIHHVPNSFPHPHN